MVKNGGAADTGATGHLLGYSIQQSMGWDQVSPGKELCASPLSLAGTFMQYYSLFHGVNIASLSRVFLRYILTMFGQPCQCSKNVSLMYHIFLLIKIHWNREIV